MILILDKRCKIDIKFLFLNLNLILISALVSLFFLVIMNANTNVSLKINNFHSFENKLIYEELHNKIVFNKSSKMPFMRTLEEQAIVIVSILSLLHLW